MARPRLTGDQWEPICDILPRSPTTGRPQRSGHMVVDGILWIMRTGAPSRDLPEEFGRWGTVYDLFTTRIADGMLDVILDILRAAHVDTDAIDEELWCVHGTVIRVARCAAGAKKGA